jgi:hypothetical protein
MVRSSGWFVLLVVALFSCAAAAQNPLLQEGKSDSLLLDEIPKAVEQWTVRCTSMEKAKLPSTGQCWRDAASALTRYTDGIGENLVNQVEQLQAAWLERAAQLEAGTVSLPAAAPTIGQSSQIGSVAPRQATAVAERPSQPTQGASRTARKPRAEKLAGAAKVVEKRRKRKQTATAAPKRKIRVVAAAKQRPIHAYRKRRNKAEVRALRSGLKDVERNLACTNLKCMIKKWQEDSRSSR